MDIRLLDPLRGPSSFAIRPAKLVLYNEASFPQKTHTLSVMQLNAQVDLPREQTNAVGPFSAFYTYIARFYRTYEREPTR